MRGIKLKDKESIILVVRQHGFVHAWSWLLSLALLTGTSYVLFWLLERGIMGQIAIGLGYGVGVIILLRMLIYMHGTKMVLTTDRIIDMYQEKAFKKEVTQIKLRDIEDVHATIKGIVGNIFRIGSMHITSVRGVSISIASVRSPLDIEDLILESIEKNKEEHLAPRTLNQTSVIKYMKELDVEELNNLLKKAMTILRYKKEQE
jgi:hypothetical protein